MSDKLSFGEMPFIKFPIDWEIKFLKGSHDNMPIRFCIKKEGSPNIVSVAVINNEPKESLDFSWAWEIAVYEESLDGSIGGICGYEANISLMDVESLLYFIKKYLYRLDEGTLNEE